MKPDGTTQFVVPIVIGPHRQRIRGEMAITGHHVYVWQLFVPQGDVDLERHQFLGVHDNSMVITVSRPETVLALYDIAREVQKLPSRGHVMWLGAIRCYRHNTGLKTYIPNTMWNPQGEQFEKPWRDIGQAYWWSSSATATPYLLIDLPAITPEMSQSRSR